MDIAIKGAKAPNLSIYFFDIVQDYPAIGGVAEFSSTLFAHLKQRYGARVISARTAATDLNIPNAGSMPYLHRERLVAQRLADRDPRSVFVFPNFQSPVCRSSGVGPRIINVLHDVQFAYLPELFSAERRETLRRTFEETRANADEIVFISEAARRQFSETIGAPRRSRVIYNPVVAETTAPSGCPREAFLVAPIHHHPHKNFSGLLAFFARMAARDPALKLVLTGHGAQALECQIGALPADVRRRVSHLGYVPRRKLDALYGRARAFISLSRFEGFNLSAAEAARHGTPLLLSDLPVHRELFSGQACFLDPEAPSLETAEAFLQACANGGQVPWPLAAQCEPARVAEAYARVIDAQIAEAARTTCAHPNARRVRMPAWPMRLEVGQAAASGLRLLAHRQRAATALAGAAAAMLMLSHLPALADGGAGGGNIPRGGVYMPGGAGGAGYTGVDGADGGSAYFGAGGGGAGGGAGGTGGASSCRICTGYTPAAGGAGGTVGSPNGQNGADADLTWSGGGGGGGGGADGNGFTGTVPATGILQGGNGGNGGSITVTGKPGGGGGGGAGGYGAVVAGSGAFASGATILGGNGGSGGSTFFASFNGGGAGDGGTGMLFSGTGATFTNTGSVAGGAGGLGGRQLTGTGTGVNGASGLGGAGIVGNGLTLINGGTITGGLSGDGITQADAVTFTGGSNVLTFTNATSGLNGRIGLQGGAALTFSQLTDVTVTNVIYGTGSLIKSGAGTLNYTGNSAGFTGTTTVTGGRLAVNGALGGPINVLSGGTLGGIGTVGETSVLNGGRVAPGNSIGTLNVNGNVTFGAGSFYAVEIAGNGTSDRINATGQAILNGGTVQVIALDPQTSYQGGQSYTILTAAGGITGSFANAVTDSIFLNVGVTGGTTGVSVSIATKDTPDPTPTPTPTPTPVLFRQVALTPNQLATAGSLDGLPQAGPTLGLYNALLLLTSGAQARQVFDELSGDIHASVQGVLVEQSSFMRNAMMGRLRASQGAVGASSAPVMSYAAAGSGGAAAKAIDDGTSALPTAATTSGSALWMTGFGAWGETAGNANAAGLSTSTGGVVMGADTALAGGWRIGLAGGYSYTAFDADARNASGNSENWHLGVYGGNQWGPVGLRTGLAYSWHGVETARSVLFPGFVNQLSADYGANTVQAFGELGYRIDTAFAVLETYANLAYVGLHTGGFGETGGAAALTDVGSGMDTAFTTLGLRVEKAIALGNSGATLNGTIGWRHAFGDITPTATQSFLGTVPFTVQGVPIAQDAAVIEAGFDIALKANAKLGVSYAGQFGDGLSQNGFDVKLNIAF